MEVRLLVPSSLPSRHITLLGFKWSDSFLLLSLFPNAGLKCLPQMLLESDDHSLLFIILRPQSRGFFLRLSLVNSTNLFRSFRKSVTEWMCSAIHRWEKHVVRVADATPEWVARVARPTETPGLLVPGSNLSTRLPRFHFQFLDLLFAFLDFLRKLFDFSWENDGMHVVLMMGRWMVCRLTSIRG